MCQLSSVFGWQFFFENTLTWLFNRNPQTLKFALSLLSYSCTVQNQWRGGVRPGHQDSRWSICSTHPRPNRVDKTLKFTTCVGYAYPFFPHYRELPVSGRLLLQPLIISKQNPAAVGMSEHGEWHGTFQTWLKWPFLSHFNTYAAAVPKVTIIC